MLNANAGAAALRMIRSRPGVVRFAERLGFSLYVLLCVVLVGRELPHTLAARASSPSPTIAAATADASPTAATAAPTVTPSASPAATRASSTPAPNATTASAIVAGYQNAGRHYAALSLPVGYVLNSPMAGTATVVVYQFLEGEVRVGSNVPSEPFFPYVTIASADRRLILRPGALGRDVRVIVENGQKVNEGSPLFAIVGSGASSWRTFYDARVSAQVIASLTDPRSGADLDVLGLFDR